MLKPTAEPNPAACKPPRFLQACAHQIHLKDQCVVAQASDVHKQATSGTVLCVQHPPVYTLGAGSTLQNALFDTANAPIPLHRTERGGEITYHGPGQLVAYPIINLKHFQPDLHQYLRQLEEIVIRYGPTNYMFLHLPCSHDV